LFENDDFDVDASIWEEMERKALEQLSQQKSSQFQSLSHQAASYDPKNVHQIVTTGRLTPEDLAGEDDFDMDAAIEEANRQEAEMLLNSQSWDAPLMQ
jgi:hypothetical protein